MEKDKNVTELMRLFRKIAKIKHVPSKFETLTFTEMTVIGEFLELLGCEGEREFVQVNEISDATGMSKPATSQILKKLEDKSLIERFTLKDDRRVVHVKLSEKGNDVFKQEKQCMDNMANKIVDEMGETDMEQFLHLCNKMTDIVGRLCNENK